MALSLQFSPDAAARADEAERTAAEGVCAFLPLLEGWQPLLRLQAVLHRVVIHVRRVNPAEHHAGSPPRHEDRFAAVRGPRGFNRVASDRCRCRVRAAEHSFARIAALGADRRARTTVCNSL